MRKSYKLKVSREIRYIKYLVVLVDKFEKNN